jgi:glycine/D-amino acid oxidase-like deaminating enzyme
VPPTVLEKDIKCEVCVIGGGITGMSIASALADKRKVVVVESGLLGEGSTGWSGGILSLATTIDLAEVALLFGEESMRSLLFFLADSIMKMRHTLALDSSTWQSGRSLYIASRKSHESKLLEEFEARRHYGLQSQFLETIHLKKYWKDVSCAVDLTPEHAVHPIKALLRLSDRVTECGGKVFEFSKADNWSHEKTKFIVNVGPHKIECDHLIITVGMEMDEFPELAELRRVCVPVSSHILVTGSSYDIADMLKDTNCIALWDSLQLYHYVRYLPNGRVLIGGAEECGALPNVELTGDDPSIKKMHEWGSELHKLTLPPVEYAWRASLSLPADGLPFLKLRLFNDDENFLISAVTDGMPFAFLLGTVVGSLLETGVHPVAQILSHRRPLPSEARLLSLLPSDGLRSLAHRAAFAAMRLKDQAGWQ